MPDKELETLFKAPHNFCVHSVVRSETSASTQIRLVNNTSTQSSGIETLLSVNCRFSSTSLQSMSQCLFNFFLFTHKMSADISKCYRRIGVDDLTAILRLFCWVEMRDGEPIFQYYKRATLDFWDPVASETVELAQLKYTIPACSMTDSRVILGHFRYADNALASFNQIEKVESVSQDLHRVNN